MYFDHGMGGWWGFAGVGVGIALFVTLALALAAAAVALSRADYPAQSSLHSWMPPSQTILDARFARGEIDATEYRERSLILRQGTEAHPEGRGR